MQLYSAILQQKAASSNLRNTNSIGEPITKFAF